MSKNKYNPVFFAENGEIGVLLGTEKHIMPDEFAAEINDEIVVLKAQLMTLDHNNTQLREKIKENEAKVMRFEIIKSIADGDRYG